MAHFGSKTPKRTTVMSNSRFIQMLDLGPLSRRLNQKKSDTTSASATINRVRKRVTSSLLGGHFLDRRVFNHVPPSFPSKGNTWTSLGRRDLLVHQCSSSRSAQAEQEEPCFLVQVPFKCTPNIDSSDSVAAQGISCPLWTSPGRRLSEGQPRGEPARPAPTLRG